uniref:Uncharacterized protein n=1 Tax=Rhizophora mucronata TaxID=61149 RepID=A0A2P2NZ91_RHIMU
MCSCDLSLAFFVALFK